MPTLLFSATRVQTENALIAGASKTFQARAEVIRTAGGREVLQNRAFLDQQRRHATQLPGGDDVRRSYG